MFLKNWYKSMARFMCSESLSCISYGAKYSGECANLNNSYGIPSWNYYSSYSGACRPTLAYSAAPSSSNNKGVIFGNGNTAPTLDDHSLAGEQFLTFTYTSSSETEITENGAKTTFTYLLTNTGSEPFTIAEIGLLMPFSFNGTIFPMLVERTVLETPVTIESGGIGLVNYTLEINYPAD